MTNPYAPDSGSFASLDVAELEARVAAGEKATAEAMETIADQLVEVKTLLSRVLEQEQGKTARRWAAYATVEDWDDLADWVDALNTTYSLNRQFAIPPCWAKHPGVAEELAALHSSWKRAAIAAESARRNGTNEHVAWHDRWLWPTLKRLREGHYDLANCKRAHTTPFDSTDRPSDRPWGSERQMGERGVDPASPA